MNLTKQVQQTPEYRAKYKLELPPPIPYQSDPDFDEMDFNANINGWFGGCSVDADNTPDKQWVSFWQRIEWRFRHYPPDALNFDDADLLACDLCDESIKIDKTDELYDEHGDGLNKLDGPYGVRDRWFLYRYEVRQTCDGETNPSNLIICDLCYKNLKIKLKKYKKETKQRLITFTGDVAFHFTTNKRKLDEIN